MYVVSLADRAECLSTLYNSFVAASYFSENSLLPGLVKGGFVEDSFAKTLLASLQDEISANPTKMPYPWLLAQFRQIGLDTYTHNFTLNYPLASDLVKTLSLAIVMILISFIYVL